VRSRGADRESQTETQKERRDRELIELLNELRVVLTGVQVLFAFLLTLPFTDRFRDLVPTQRLMFSVAFTATAMASVLLMAPTAYHRIRFRQRDKERMLRWSNRFAIVVRGGDPGRARAAAAALLERGLPNFFGPQRFGTQGRNAGIGRAILRGEGDPEARRAARDRFVRRLSISAYQAALFNRWLAARMADGLFAAALAGDVMKKLDTGGLFTCEDPAADGPRVARFEISPAGPMFGHALRPAAGEALAREERILAGDEMTLADFARGGGEAEGTRRAARLRVEVAIEPLAGGYRTSFELPKGSYATVVMRELVKSEAELPEEDA